MATPPPVRPENLPEQEPEDIFEVLEPKIEGQQEVRVEKVREALEQHGARFEQHPEVPSQVRETPSALPPSAPMAIPIAAEQEKLQHIERVLAEGLQDIFTALPPVERQKFKIAGEQAAREVQGLLGQVKVQVGKVIEVIRRWLGTLPGVNRLFVEQESKIKAQKLVGLVTKE
jgi:hypothetical protein